MEYIEAVLEGYLTAPAREAALHLRDLILEKVLETVGDGLDPNLTRRVARGSDDGLGMEDRASNVSISSEEMQVVSPFTWTL